MENEKIYDLQKIFPEGDDSELSEEMVYDSVFWSAINSLKEYVPYLINEAFKTHYTQNARITFLSNKKVTLTTSGSFERRDVDSLLEIKEFPDYEEGRLYHFECEVRGTSRIAIRIGEYAAAYAFENIHPKNTGAEIYIPYSAVIFLRYESSDISELTIRIKYPEGKAEYKVPVLQMKHYDIEAIFRKKLLLLLPFFAFRYSEREYSTMDKDISQTVSIKRNMTEIKQKLEELVLTKELDRRQQDNIIRYTYKVLSKILLKHNNVKKEMREYMGGVILKTDVDIAWEAGIKQGREQGMEQGMEQGIEQGMEQGIEQGIELERVHTEAEAQRAQKAEKQLAERDIELKNAKAYIKELENELAQLKSKH